MIIDRLEKIEYGAVVNRERGVSGFHEKPANAMLVLCAVDSLYLPIDFIGGSRKTSAHRT